MPDAKEALLELDTRRTIFRHVEEHPGLHLRGLQRALDIPLGTLEYHLHQMEKANLLVSRDDGRFKAFFVAEGLDRRDKEILYYVRQEMPRQIIMQLLLEPGTTHGALTEHLPISASTCSFHLKKLVASGLVMEQRVGRTKQFSVDDADRVANVLVRYRKSFLDDLVDRFARAWLDVNRVHVDKSEADADDEAGSNLAPEAAATSLPQPEDAAKRTDETPNRIEAIAHRRVVRFRRRQVPRWLAHAVNWTCQALLKRPAAIF